MTRSSPPHLLVPDGSAGHRDCWVSPHPELLGRMRGDLGEDHELRTLVELRRSRRPLGYGDGTIIPPNEFPLGTPMSVIRGAAAQRAPLRGAVRVLVVLVDFPDLAMTTTAAHLQELFFSNGVLPHGSVKEYYLEATHGLIEIVGDVVGPFRMSRPLSVYTNGGSGLGPSPSAADLAREAALAARPHVNFAPFDNDGNGLVDAFIVVHAGPGAETTGSTADIWSHKSTMAGGPITADGVRVFGYLTVPEDCRIGVCCHELGHLLFGFPDLYDTDQSSEGIGDWCLMAAGSWNGGGIAGARPGDVPAHPSAWCKAAQGWVDVTSPSSNGMLTIPDVKDGHGVLHLSPDGMRGTEYFLVENRQRSGFDAGLPGGGLLVWHVDESQRANTDDDHYMVALIQADARRDLELSRNRGDDGDPFPGSRGNTALGSTTRPSTRSRSGVDTRVALTNVSPSGPVMTAQVDVVNGARPLEGVAGRQDQTG